MSVDDYDNGLNELLQEAKEEGYQEGIADGFEKGSKEGYLKALRDVETAFNVEVAKTLKEQAMQLKLDQKRGK